MIENEKQYLVAREQVERLEAAIARIGSRSTPDAIDPALVAGMKSDVRSLLASLRRELKLYEVKKGVAS